MHLFEKISEVASDHVEGGMYIGPEFLLGEVYDGTTECGESIILYKPVYPTVKASSKSMQNTQNSSMNNSSQPQSSASTPTATKGLKVDVSKDHPHPLVVHQNQQQTKSATTNSSNSMSNSAANAPSSSTKVSGGSSQQKPSTSSSKRSTKDNENANAVLGESDIMTTASAETSKSSVADATRPHTSSKKIIFNTAATSSSGYASTSSDTSNDKNTPSEPQPSSSNSSSSNAAKRKSRISSTSSTGKLDGTEEEQKHAKNATVTFSSDGIKDSASAGAVGTGSESKNEKADKNVIKKVVTTTALPGRAVKLLESTGSRKSLVRDESLGESTQSAELGHSSRNLLEGEQKTKV
jgi:hypothetical protein